MWPGAQPLPAHGGDQTMDHVPRLRFKVKHFLHCLQQQLHLLLRSEGAVSGVAFVSKEIPPGPVSKQRP